MMKLFVILALVSLLVSVSLAYSGSECPPFGCSLFPRDVAFDEKARGALKHIRAELPGSEFNQALGELEMCGDEDKATMTLVGFKGGKLEEQINQDRAFVLSPFDLINGQNCQVLGVFDGHGDMGEVVAQYAVTELPKRLKAKLGHLKAGDNDKIIQQALIDSFIEIDKDVPTKGVGGCTASVVLQIGSKLYIANAGDSRSIVALYIEKTDDVKVLYVTREDKPHLEDERARIESMGGRVYIPDDLTQESSRVVSGSSGLAMSRSLGDWDMLGKIADPIVKIIDVAEVIRTEIEESNAGCSEDEEYCPGSLKAEHISIFAMSASDGMMDYIEPQDLAGAFATTFYRPSGPHPLVMCEDLILIAAKGWYDEMKGHYRDDIAVAAARIVVEKLTI
jgi:serine/threonine protein phosphatase PrpC